MRPSPKRADRPLGDRRVAGYPHSAEAFPIMAWATDFCIFSNHFGGFAQNEQLPFHR